MNIIDILANIKTFRNEGFSVKKNKKSSSQKRQQIVTGQTEVNNYKLSHEDTEKIRDVVKEISVKYDCLSNSFHELCNSLYKARAYPAEYDKGYLQRLDQSTIDIHNQVFDIEEYLEKIEMQFQLHKSFNNEFVILKIKILSLLARTSSLSSITD